jgi:hypothetical protein
MTGEPMGEEARPATAPEASTQSTIAELLGQIAERDRRIAALEARLATRAGTGESADDRDAARPTAPRYAERFALLTEEELEHLRYQASILQATQAELREARAFIARVRASRLWRTSSVYWRTVARLRGALGR